MNDPAVAQRGRDVVRDVLDKSQRDHGRARALPEPIQSGPRRQHLSAEVTRMLP